MQKQKGSITIFSLLSLLLVMTTLFAFLEFTRFYEIRRLAGLQTQTALESVFADYSSYLWENYQLLGCKNAEVQVKLKEYGNSHYDRFTKRNNFLLFQAKKADVKEYTLITDGKGSAYMHEVSDYMKKHILYETAKKIFNRYEAVKQLKENSSMDLNDIDTALKQLEEKESSSSEEENSVGTSKSANQKKETIGKNILETVKKLQKNGVLELVLKDTDHLSEKKLSLREAVSGRKLKMGNQEIEETDWMDKIWLQQYFLMVMSNFCEIKDQRSMDYEMEYLIGGKANDHENLKVVATELLAIREAANFLYLLSDTQKIKEAEAAALVLAGASANPLLIETIKIAMLTAWAFGESILDVRALLQNKKIPLLKNADLWTLEFENIGELTKGYMVAKESSSGLVYEDYLGILLFFQGESKLAMRGMDVQEATLQSLYHDENIQFDQIMVRAEIEMVYTYEPVFCSFNTINWFKRWRYEVRTVKNFGYY